MEEQIQGLVALAFDKYTLLVAGAIYIALRGIHSTRFSKWWVYRRVLPFLPESLGCLAAAFGGLPVMADQPILVRLAAGLWCGYLAQKGHKILGQTILGDDKHSMPKLAISSQLPSPESQVEVTKPEVPAEPEGGG